MAKGEYDDISSLLIIFNDSIGFSSPDNHARSSIVESLTVVAVKILITHSNIDIIIPQSNHINNRFQRILQKLFLVTEIECLKLSFVYSFLSTADDKKNDALIHLYIENTTNRTNENTAMVHHIDVIESLLNCIPYIKVIQPIINKIAGIIATYTKLYQYVLNEFQRFLNQYLIFSVQSGASHL